jgi:NADH-quinone oxidoreductase subunit N
LFVLAAFLFKIGAAPFHLWLADVYEGAILSVTFIFSVLPKIIIFSLFVKLFVLVFSPYQNFWTLFLTFSSLLSIFIGTFSALYQKRLKRLFAYSTIVHTGFVLLGIICASPDSIKSLSFYVVVYSLITILLFSLLIFIVFSTKKLPSYLSNWTSSGLKNFVFIASFSVTLFSIAGIPPFIGFFSKFLILLSFVQQNYIVSASVIVIISSIACFYYIRLIKIFFFVKSSRSSFWISSSQNSYLVYVISIIMLLNFFFFLRPELIYLFSSFIGFALL